MHNDKESPFSLTLINDDLSLQVLRFEGREALNQPFRFDIEALGLAPALPLERLLQQPACLDFGQGPGIHGVLHTVCLQQHGLHRVGYKLVLVPALQALDRHRSRRVFEHLSVPMILRLLLQAHDLPETGYRFELATGHYPLRPFCIQYEETDLALLQRLCEEEGIHYHFEHHRDAHVLVFADDCLSFTQQPLLMPFLGDTGKTPAISELFQRHDSPPPSLQQNANHAFIQPARTLIEQRHRDQRVCRHLERLRCRQRQVHGQSNHRELHCANIVQVAEHPLPELNDQWLVIEARHQGCQGSILAPDASDAAPHYRNRFTAIAWSTVFRPPIKQPRPSITGYQPARVCGPSGQPATLDEQGRIQVSLWPATDSDPLQSSGLWLPLALSATGNHLDRSSLPLAGSHGQVAFLDGDVDRPVFCSRAVHHRPSRPACQKQPRRENLALLDWLLDPR
ncbi:type VI secretion system Vgr family protein [Pseudomonas sp. NPDC089569]|uniref:type VI secretion system Vgr family protein n=1 Tax=Pseudomonas sp. NPDC089569 TaxID=3390722 RepID=UPI003D04B9C1